MIKVVFLGFGNVNSHLCRAMAESEQVSVMQVFNRTAMQLPKTLQAIPFTTQLSEIKEADVYILGIPDDAIESFSETLPLRDQLIVHTSGGVAMDALSNQNRKGVLYPLQTFSKQRTIALDKVPICIEASAPEDLGLLRQLGSTISEIVVEISSEERAKLHVSAVFVNNFVNYLYTVSEELLAKNNLNFELLKPLILETAHKIETLSPSEAQTGPAKRNDRKTIEKHVHLLKDSPYKELYTQLTQAIETTYGKKL
ncbi:MAG: DUF2520 domain-containing protein [Flavobacteriales bacterium]|jgi:predicted short-subunit dehydrogenase-like oxidoreductase (DUF2520 family)|nr:DUF2520 domain-containing protein [Flavobacteriales bacterium]